MARYIDMNELLNAIDKRNGRLPSWLDEILMVDCKVADVALVVHAHWIKRRYGLRKIYYHCSHCHFGLSKIGDDHYCNYCGAKMDEEV